MIKIFVKVLIITILIFIKVIGIASHAKAEFVYDENYIKDYRERFKREYEERQWDLENTRLKQPWEWEKEWEKERKMDNYIGSIFSKEDTKIITIVDLSYSVELLNSCHEKYYITNLFEVLSCVDNSLI